MRREYAIERDRKMAFHLLPVFVVYFIGSFIIGEAAIFPALLTMIIMYFVVKQHHEWWEVR